MPMVISFIRSYMKSHILHRHDDGLQSIFYSNLIQIKFKRAIENLRGGYYQRYMVGNTACSSCYKSNFVLQKRIV